MGDSSKSRYPLVPGSEDTPDIPSMPRPKKLQALAKAIADPLDFRRDEELSEELGFSRRELVELYADRGFMDTVLVSFQRNLRSMAPFLVKTIMAQAKGGSVGAAKLLLQAAGMGGDGPSVQVNIGSDQGARDALTSLTDDALDAEIRRLQEDIQGADVTYRGGRISPVDPVEVEVLDAVDAPAHRSGRDHPQTEARETGEVLAGEAEEDG